jgi:hypothetical protein
MIIMGLEGAVTCTPEGRRGFCRAVSELGGLGVVEIPM